jgi:hypothetical protein
MDNMIDLLLEFKNNRTNLVKYALSLQAVTWDSVTCVTHVVVAQ